MEAALVLLRKGGAVRDIDLPDPNDPAAVKTHDKYWRWVRDVEGSHGRTRRTYSWYRESNNLTMVAVTLIAIGGVILGVPPWSWLLAASAAVVYWYFVCSRRPMFVRRYDRFVRARRIVRIPRFLYEAVTKEARFYPGLTAWDEWQVSRYQLLLDVCVEQPGTLSALQGDCGCVVVCHHLHRLPPQTRKDFRLKLRREALMKLQHVVVTYRVSAGVGDVRPPRLPHPRQSEE